MSSAYRMMGEIKIAREFIYTINKRGPSMEPWGTPDVTGMEVGVPVQGNSLGAVRKVALKPFEGSPIKNGQGHLRTN